MFTISTVSCFCCFFGSNAERVREFIKNVYVQKKYAGANAADKPPNDNQASVSLLLVLIKDFHLESRVIYVDFEIFF